MHCYKLYWNDGAGVMAPNQHRTHPADVWILNLCFPTWKSPQLVLPQIFSNHARPDRVECATRYCPQVMATLETNSAFCEHSWIEIF